ncbi:hypothetical protein Dimus_030710 [Dionaea muscipula]
MMGGFEHAGKYSHRLEGVPGWTCACVMMLISWPHVKGFTARMSPLPAWACFMDIGRNMPLLAARRTAARRLRLPARWCRCSQPLAARRAPLTQLEIAEVELPVSQASVGRAKTVVVRACCPPMDLLAYISTARSNGHCMRCLSMSLLTKYVVVLKWRC